MPIAPDIKLQVEDLLRTDTRLASAAPLLGQVHALISEPKPPPQPKPKKLAPLRPGETPEDREDDEEEEEETKKVPGVPPWLKVARVKKVTDDLRELFGDKALAYVAVDGWLWNHLDAQGKRAALVFALRGLHHLKRKKDSADDVKIERPPLQTWADTADELSELVAALTEDPAEAAEQSNAASAIGNRRLASLEAAVRELLRAWQVADLGVEQDEPDVFAAIDDLADLVSTDPDVVGGGSKTEWSPDLVASGRHGDVSFWHEDDGEVRHFEIGWGHCSRDSFSDADWSACGFGLYEGGDLHDGYSTVREVMHVFRGDVFASLEDYKAGRATTITEVLDVARAWADLPPIAETEDEWLDGEPDSDEDGVEDES